MIIQVFIKSLTQNQILQVQVLRCNIYFITMYSPTTLQETLFYQCFTQRQNEVKRGIRIHYEYSEFKILYSNKFQRAEEILRFRQLMQKQLCLGIYTLNGKLMSKIQTFQIKVRDDDEACFTTTSLFLENGLINHFQYYLTIYRNASDYAYKNVLSSDHKKFVQRQTYKSQQILRYIKGEIPQVPVDQIFHFQPQNNLRNEEQKTAIIKSGLSSVMLIEGPAGVGKTFISCKIGRQFLQKGKKVIMVTVTNTGAKMICEHMTKQFMEVHDIQEHSSLLSNLKAIMRVQSEFKSIQKQEFAIEYYDNQIKKIVKKMQQKPQRINFLYFNLLVTFEQYYCLQPHMRFYSFNTQLIINMIKITAYKMPVLDILVNLNKMANKVLVSDEFKEIYLKAVRNTIKNADLVITNTTRAAELNRHQESHQLFKPYLAIFDEAAQATLADTYCILSFDIKRLFLIGDEKQLPPTSKTPQQINSTLFSILKSKPNRRLVQFAFQYRMHSEIAKLVDYLTYGGQLKNGFKKEKHVSEIEGFFKYPVFMVTHNGKQEQPKFSHETGFFNIQQIKMIKLYIDQFADQELKNVGIITGYKAQQKLMKQIFKNEVKLGLSISTVDGYQGAEKDYIIFSVVRSNQMGVLGDSEDRHRINVGLSRARKGLMIVGNICTLQNGRYYNPWKWVISYLWKSDLIFHFPENLNEKADKNYFTRKERNVSQQIEVDRIFDIESEESDQESQFYIQKEVTYNETDEQPFVASNYN